PLHLRSFPTRRSSDLDASDRSVITLDDGRRVLLRPLIHGDIDLDRRFIEKLSPKSRRFRFLSNIQRPSEDLLEQLADVDQNRRLDRKSTRLNSSHVKI